jgi:hypothetical protein
MVDGESFVEGPYYALEGRRLVSETLDYGKVLSVYFTKFV